MINNVPAIDTVKTLAPLTVDDIHISISDIIAAHDAYKVAENNENDTRVESSAALDTFINYKHDKGIKGRFTNNESLKNTPEYHEYERLSIAHASAIADKDIAARYSSVLKRTYLRQCAALIADIIVRNALIDGIPCHYKKSSKVIINALKSYGINARGDDRGYKNIYIDDMGLYINPRDDGRINIDFGYYNGEYLNFHSRDIDVDMYAYNNNVWSVDRLASYARDYRAYCELKPSNIYLACTEYASAQSRIDSAKAQYNAIVEKIKDQYKIYGFNFKS